MPVTDTEQLIREAVVSVAEANTALQGVIGGSRTSGWIIEVEQANADTPLPILAYDLEQYDEATGNALLRLSAVADQAGGSAKCRAILEAALAGFTWTAFSAKGLEMVPGTVTRQSVPLDDDTRGRLGRPMLAQADALLPLLLTESLQP